MLVALPVALLAVWASLRFDAIEDFLESGHALVAMVFLLGLPMPFLIAHGTGQGWQALPGALP